MRKHQLLLREPPPGTCHLLCMRDLILTMSLGSSLSSHLPTYNQLWVLQPGNPAARAGSGVSSSPRLLPAKEVMPVHVSQGAGARVWGGAGESEADPWSEGRGGADLSSHPCSVPSSLGGLGQPLSLEPRFPHLRGVLVVLPASRGGSLGL